LLDSLQSFVTASEAPLYLNILDTTIRKPL